MTGSPAAPYAATLLRVVLGPTAVTPLGRRAFAPSPARAPGGRPVAVTA